MCIPCMLEESPCAGEHTLTHLAGENGGLFCYKEEERENVFISKKIKLHLLAKITQNTLTDGRF